MLRFVVFLVVVCLAAGSIADDKAKKKGVPAHLQLQVVTLKESLACDKKAQPGDHVAMHYTGKLQSNGQTFDSSRTRGEPLVFELGAGRVIQGSLLQEKFHFARQPVDFGIFGRLGV